MKNGLLMFDPSSPSINGFTYFTEDFKLKNITTGYIQNGASLRGITTINYNNQPKILGYGSISHIKDDLASNIIIYEENSYKIILDTLISTNIDYVGRLTGNKIIIIGGIEKFAMEKVTGNCMICDLSENMAAICKQLSGSNIYGLPNYGGFQDASFDGSNIIYIIYYDDNPNGPSQYYTSSTLVAWNMVNETWTTYATIAYHEYGNYVLAWENKQLVFFGCTVNVSTCDNVYGDRFVWWNEQKQCFEADRVNEKILGNIIHGVKGELTKEYMVSYYLTMSGYIFQYKRNLNSSSGNVMLNVTGDLDILSLGSFPYQYALQSDETGRVFLIGGQHGFTFWMDENNLGVWKRFDFEDCVIQAQNSMIASMAFINGSMFYSCPGLQIASENMIIYKVDFQNETAQHTLYTNITNTFYAASVQTIKSCGKNSFFTFGEFTSIGNNTMTGGASFWNGEEWETVFYKDYVIFLYSKVFKDKLYFALNDGEYIKVCRRDCTPRAVLDCLTVTNFHYGNVFNFAIDHVTGIGYIAVAFNEIIIYSFNTDFEANNTFNPVIKFNNTQKIYYFTSLAAHNNYLFVGGYFTMNIDGHVYNNIFLYQLNEDQSNGTFLPFVGTEQPNNAGIQTLYIYDDILYIGGQFTKILTQSANNIIAYNITSQNYSQEINERFANFLPAPGESVYQILYTPFQSTFYLLTWKGGYQYNVYYQQNTSINFVLLEKTAYAIDLFDYPPFKLSIFYIILISFGAFFLFLIPALFLLVYFKNKRDKLKSNYILIPDFSENSIQNNLELIMRDSDVPKIDKNKLVLGEPIGIGGQALVRRGEYKGEKIAAKSILQMGDSQFSEFLREIKLLCSLKHENILRTIGICIHSQELLLITEMMDTDLEKVMNRLDAKKKFRCCFQIAEAIKYMHSFDPPILHRDLKPSNILVSKKGIFKLSDFGVSRVSVSKFQENTMTRDVGTVIYMAPEIMLSSKYGELADIYSLGLLFIEVYIEKNPYYSVKIEFLLDFIEKFKNKEMIPEYPNEEEDNCPPLLISLMKQMTSLNPKERPPASIILTTMKEKRMQVQLEELSEKK